MLKTCVTWGLVVLFASTVWAQQPQQPGPEHEMLKQSVGTWETSVSEGGDATKGVSEATLALGGMWISSTIKMDFGGQAFEGHGMDGYDQAKKKYVSVWFDSMTSAPMFFEGDYDAASKTLTLVADSTGPDGKPAKFKTTTKFHSKDHHTFTMMMVGPNGMDIPMLTIEYKRKK